MWFDSYELTVEESRVSTVMNKLLWFDSYELTVEESRVSTVMNKLLWFDSYELTVEASHVGQLEINCGNNLLWKWVAIRQLWIDCRNKSRFDSYE